MSSQMLAALATLALLGLIRAHPERLVIPPEEMDVFVPVHRPSCVTSKVVERLNIHFGPRRILVATAVEHCPTVEAYAGNVRCLDEDKVLAGNITKQWVSSVIAKMLQVDEATLAPATARWYMQRLLKLGVVNSPLLLDDPVSGVYLAWDADMILLNKFEAYDSRGRIALMAGWKSYSSFLQLEGAEVQDELSDSCNHHVVFQRLTGMDSVTPPTGGSYVPHHMVMRRVFVRDLIEAFGGKHGWAWNILGTSCGEGDGYAFCKCAFNEYHTMASFAKLNHEKAVFDRAANYTRYRSEHCCPHDGELEKNADKLLVRFEQGQCGEGAGAGRGWMHRHSALRR